MVISLREKERETLLCDCALRPRKQLYIRQSVLCVRWKPRLKKQLHVEHINPYPTAFPYGNGMVLHFYQQQESSTTKTVHKVINRGLKAYV